MQFITSNVDHCTSVTLLKLWSTVSNFWPKYSVLSGRLIGCRLHVSQSPSGSCVPFMLTHLSFELLFFLDKFKYVMVHSCYYLSLFCLFKAVAFYVYWTDSCKVCH